MLLYMVLGYIESCRNIICTSAECHNRDGKIHPAERTLNNSPWKTLVETSHQGNKWGAYNQFTLSLYCSTILVFSSHPQNHEELTLLRWHLWTSSLIPISSSSLQYQEEPNTDVKPKSLSYKLKAYP